MNRRSLGNKLTLAAPHYERFLRPCIFLPNWCDGRPTALDVTVISTMQPLTQAGAASEAGFALKVAEARKLASHNAECHNIGVFIPPCCC